MDIQFATERPDRIVTAIDTADFVANWIAGADSFATDAPNAVLVLDDEQIEYLVVELFNPTYDSDANTLMYDIILENATSTDLPDQFGWSSLVIDPGAPGSGPVNNE